MMWHRYRNVGNRYIKKYFKQIFKNKITSINVGPTLLIVIPYKKDDELYSTLKIKNYINLHNLNPSEIR